MTKQLTAIFLIFLFHIAKAQYWQQKVDYRINVKLDDQTNRIYADISFDYLNNSPNTLDSLYLHVWPNAYKDGKSALAKQLKKEGEKLAFMDSSDLGGISALDFKINGKKSQWTFDPLNPDIVFIRLEQSLLPGQSLTVSTPFVVKIPSGSISRLGHIGQSYQITQWYPKPAVYDHKGWHPMPYLNQGEFYSEYGSFDVHITVPKNYVVGATGVLQNMEEKAFMDSLALSTQMRMHEIISLPAGAFRDSFPPTSKEWKTLHFKQDNVHDFAWFADKRFCVLKGEVVLPNTVRKVTSWALFTPTNAKVWQNAIEYINDGTYYYSKWNGDYPYDAVTAVDGTISAGGGMEYPMITVIGNSGSARELEVVIVHEVGHNWFYGILGSNERLHGWMDEGMNTANEMRYVATKYPDNQDMSAMVMDGKLHLNDLDHHDLADIMYRFLAMVDADQPIETHSAEFSSANYGVTMYQKTGLIFQYLRYYLGDKLYDQCMQRYYELYQFKHPYPEDMQRVVEGVSGKKLDWLFGSLIQTTDKIDYKIKSVRSFEAMNVHTVTLINKGNVEGPMSVSAVTKEGKILETQWTESHEKKSALIFNGDPALSHFVIDPERNIPELNRSNNWFKINKFFCKKQEPLAFEFLFGDNEQDKNNVFWTPMVAFNHSDKAMLGLVFHNLGLPFKSLQYLISPMYSFGRNTVGGVAEISKTCYPSFGPKSIKTGLSVKSFGIGDEPVGQRQSFYLAATPYMKINLVSDRNPKGYLNAITLKLLARRDVMAFDVSTEYGFKINHSIQWNRDRFSYGSQMQLEGVVGYQDQVLDPANFLRISTSLTFNFNYLDRKIVRSLKLRLYGGYNLAYNPGSSYYNAMGRYSISMFGSAGYQDLFSEQYYFNRATVSGAQYNDDMGGFRTGSDQLRMSNYWATSANFTLQLPVKPNIFVAFADLGVYDNGVGISTLYNAGLGINLGDIVGVYFPLVQSTNMGSLFQNYSSSIRLTLKINPFNLPLSWSTLINN